MLNRIVTLIVFTFCSSCPLFAAKTTKVVFLHGDRSHASGDHEFKAGSHLLANHLRKQKAAAMKVLVIKGWPEDESVLDDADSIIVYSDATKVVQHGWEKMDSLVKKGVGLLFMHYAVHPSEEMGEKYFKPWIGGYFKNGQSVNPFWKADIKAMESHEVSNGLGKIEAIDEWYFKIDYAENAIPLGVATPNEKNLRNINNLWTKAGFLAKGEPQALLWGIVREDGSRGAGFTGGHKHQNWALTDYRKLVLNTIFWISGLEVPNGGVPTAEVTEAELNQNLDDYAGGIKRIELPNAQNQALASNGPWLTPEQHAEMRGKRNKKKKKK